MNDSNPFWFDRRSSGDFTPLDQDLDTDVLIIGGGITGVTAAWLLAGEGKSVTLVEREKIGVRDTGHTTAHLTYMTDTRLSDLIATFSRDDAHRAWDGGAEAMKFIADTAAELKIDCGLRKVPGYLAVAEGADASQESSLLSTESLIARQMGFGTSFVEGDPATLMPAIRFAEQMHFHPLRYIDALASAAAEKGARIFEETAVAEFTGDNEVKAGSHTIRFRKVFIATHVPLQGNASMVGAALFQTKLALYSTYAVRAEIREGHLPEMIWSDTADPFLYLRVQKEPDGQLTCILGGEDHKTGQEKSAEERYTRLESRLRRMIPGAVPTHRWSGQVVETVDGLPYIGPTSESQFIATGFSGDGMTFGTLSALMFRDWVRGDSNRWEKLFDPSRRTSACLEYLKQNKDFPIRMITDRLHVEKGDPADLAPGEGKVLEHEGKRLAASKDQAGALTTCSAICPHMGCIVAWNDAEGTWDCPCHGSRFTSAGKVIAGPAESDLEKV